VTPRANANGNGHQSRLAGGAGIFDLDAAVAAAREMDDAPVPFAFTYQGERYELPPQQRWPVEALEALGRTDDQGNNTPDVGSALRALLGAEPARRILKAGLAMDEFQELLDAAAKAAGVGGAPNSSPPPLPATTRT